MDIGNVVIRAARYDLALEEYLGALNHMDRSSPAAGNLYLQIGQVYVQKGEPDFGVIFLRQAKELLAGNGAVLGALAVALHSAGRTDEAAQEYRAALNADPNDARALNNLAFLLAEEENNLDAALQYAERARQLQPDSADFTDTLAWIYVKKHRTDEAVGILRGVLQRDPARSSFHYHLGVALEQKGDHAAAIQELKTALKSNPPKDEGNEIQDLIQRISKQDSIP